MDDRSTPDRALERTRQAARAAFDFTDAQRDAFARAQEANRVALERALNALGAVHLPILFPEQTAGDVKLCRAEEAAITPWARWKSASRELVEWWAARLMSALYISPKRKHPQKSSSFVPHNETGNACPTCGGQA